MSPNVKAGRSPSDLAQVKVTGVGTGLPAVPDLRRRPVIRRFDKFYEGKGPRGTSGMIEKLRLLR